MYICIECKNNCNNSICIDCKKTVCQTCILDHFRKHYKAVAALLVNGKLLNKKEARLVMKHIFTHLKMSKSDREMFLMEFVARNRDGEFT